ncbi:MAG: hypothetical protein RMM06_05955, partial [Armatimonadota bacterium]|nr:hypothetical protein [Armatimonadota bacterium]
MRTWLNLSPVSSSPRGAGKQCGVDLSPDPTEANTGELETPYHLGVGGWGGRFNQSPGPGGGRG